MRKVLLYPSVIAACTAAFAAAPLASGAPTDDGGALGSLAPEFIQRVVRSHFGMFKICYSAGLRNNPRLAGRVATKFVIDRTGHVSQSSEDPSSDLPDANVRKCVADTFKTLEFPPPTGGVVTVIYPLIFSPGDGNAPSDAGASDAARPKG